MKTFLEIYRNHECLLNNKSENYNKTNIHEKAYKTLHSELNLPQLSVNDIKAKIKTIRIRYCSELAKIRKSEKSGAGSNDLYVPRLFWFKQADSFFARSLYAKGQFVKYAGKFKFFKILLY